MPKLDKDAPVEVKLDSAAAMLEAALTEEQRRGLFEHPGMCVIVIAELHSVSYTGHADSEDKAAQVRLRMRLVEAARDDEQTGLVLEVMRAMMRRRKMTDTLDEVGPGETVVEEAVTEALAGHPTEAEFEAHQETTRRRRGSRVEQFG
ncbi:hypothetical protein [Streptomyces seoulensis]|uniref:hypothetical protein n=1 Tax=Streptomyces seoulensis TaxID=73044 RepID=UPI001FCC2EE7|nr:hypothetical protein [Streptomyces seoulensis]BDH04868.1 hypothetical protein HEK131_20950 [Streptomyces seoulensis]